METTQSQQSQAQDNKPSTESAINLITLPDSSAPLPELWKILDSLFIHHSPGKYFQRDDGKYAFVDQVVVEQEIKDHIRGQLVLGVPLAFTETGGSFVKNVVIDVDVIKEVWEKEGFKYEDCAETVDNQIALLQEQADNYGIPYYTEFSGFKGKHIYIFFEDYVPLAKGFKFLHSLFGPDMVRNIDPAMIAWELFPKTDSAGSKSMVKLPYALHKKSHKRAEWVDNCFPENGDPIQKLSIARLDELLSPMWAPVIQCKALNDMYGKVKSANHLSNDERVCLGTIYTKIPGGHDFITEEFISRCEDYKPEVTADKLSRMRVQDYRAISCETLRANGICAAQCDRIKKRKSPLAFYYRQTGNHEASEKLDEKISEGFYFIRGNKFWKRGDKVKKKNGETVQEEDVLISDFTLIIKESRKFLDVFDDKLNTSFTCEVRIDNQISTISLTSSELYDQKAMQAAIMNVMLTPVTIMGSPGDFLRAVRFFNDSDVIKGFSTPGWSPEKDLFVTPSVIITKESIQPNTKYFIKETNSVEIGNFDLCILKDEDKKNLFRIISEYLLNATEPEIAMSMLGYAAYSIIEPFINEHLRQNRFALFISGPSGRGKTHIATHFYHLFGNFSSITSWTSTVNSLNQMGHYLNGGMFLVDDFKNKNISLDESLKLFQNYADHNGRSRMTRTIDLQITKPMRCGLMTTGEHSVTQEASSVARIVNLEMTKLVAEEQKMINAQIVRAYELFPGFFPDFIKGILNADWKQLIAECESYIQEFEKRAGDRPNGTRVASNHAILLFSTRLVLSYLFGDEALVKEKVEQARKYLEDRMDATLLSVSSFQNHEQFLQMLRNMLSRNEVSFSVSSKTLNMTETNSKTIGHQASTGSLYLDVDNAYDHVVKTARMMGREFTYPLLDLKRDLILNGIIVQKSEKVTVDKKGKRMFKMLKNIYDDDNAKPIAMLE